MLKTILTAACASALLAGAALAQSSSQPSTFDRSTKSSGRAGPDAGASPKMQNETDRRALSERGRRTGEQGGIPSQENPNGANSLPPTGSTRAMSADGGRHGSSRDRAAGLGCDGRASEEETTRCLNRHSLANVEGGAGAGAGESMRGGSAGESRRDPMTTQGRNRDK